MVGGVKDDKFVAGVWHPPFVHWVRVSVNMEPLPLEEQRYGTIKIEEDWPISRVMNAILESREIAFVTGVSYPSRLIRMRLLHA